MLEHRSHAQYINNPVRGITSGERWLCWQTSETVGGIALWDRVDYRTIQELITMCEAITVSRGKPFTVIFDIRHAREIEREGFLKMLTALATMSLPYASLDLYPIADMSVASVALLGLAHLRISHSLNLPSKSYTEVDVLDTVDARTIEAWVDRYSAPRLVDRLAAWLITQPVDVPIQQAGRALGLSSRSLQRALAEAGTTYRTQILKVKRQRLAEAVLGTNDKLDSIAVSLGFSSGSSLSTTFKRVFGQSPSEFRASQIRGEAH